MTGYSAFSSNSADVAPGMLTDAGGLSQTPLDEAGHCNTSAIMGVGASRSIKRVNWSIAKNMLLAWVITFPACGLIGFVLAKLFMMLA